MCPKQVHEGRDDALHVPMCGYDRRWGTCETKYFPALGLPLRPSEFAHTYVCGARARARALAHGDTDRRRDARGSGGVRGR